MQSEPRDTDYDWMSIDEWYAQHRAMQQEVLKLITRDEREIDILLLGDSITQDWPSSLWQSYFKSAKILNFGLGGDRIQHLNWRIQHSEIDRLAPRLLLLNIGTNNIHFAAETALQIGVHLQTLMQQLARLFPDTLRIVHAITPREQTANHPYREDIRAINNALHSLAPVSGFQYVDFSAVFLKENGEVKHVLMDDYIHPNTAGYTAWSERLFPFLKNCLHEREGDSGEC